MPSSVNALSQIPGRYIVEAMDSLPPCGADSEVQQVDIDVPFWGRFRVTFMPFRHRVRGHPVHWIWVAKHAEGLESDA
jgi:hypothetical protein